jgi:hypothetical protein
LLVLFLQPAPSGFAQSFGVSYLKVAPIEAHPGSLLYLTGANLPRNTQEFVTVACPSALDAGPNFESFQGPTSDSHGRFVGFGFRAITPAGNSAQWPPVCTVYVTVGSNYFGPDIPAKFIIRPTGQKLDTCAVHICGVKVHAAPLQAKTGWYEQITIRDPLWPGAKATVSLKYPQGQAVSRITHLDYDGSASLRWPVTARVAAGGHSLKATIGVHLQLGTITGAGQTHFTVVH